jgi:hypothetical protein
MKRTKPRIFFAARAFLSRALRRVAQVRALGGDGGRRV